MAENCGQAVKPDFVGFRLTWEEGEAVRKLACDRGVSLSFLVRELVQFEINRMSGLDSTPPASVKNPARVR